MMKIVVVGGGSAAWITASYLHENLDCDLTVIHDDKDAIIGVGESTTPAIRKVITNLPDWLCIFITIGHAKHLCVDKPPGTSGYQQQN